MVCRRLDTSAYPETRQRRSYGVSTCRARPCPRALILHLADAHIDVLFGNSVTVYRLDGAFSPERPGVAAVGASGLPMEITGDDLCALFGDGAPCLRLGSACGETNCNDRH